MNDTAQEGAQSVHDMGSDEDGGRRLMYYEPQLQEDQNYSGLLDHIPANEARALLVELLKRFPLRGWASIPLPCLGLPGLNGDYDQDEPAADLLKLGIDYAVAMIRNERKTMHHRWKQARDMLRDAENQGYERVIAEEVQRALERSEVCKPVSQFVYFIGAASGPIKIGMATEPERRLRGLQTAHHEPLELLATCGGGQPQEVAYHKQFANRRLHGEWFERCPEIEAEIERLKAAA